MEVTELDSRIEQSLRETLEEIAKDGELLSRENLDRSYATFRERFCPDKLKALNGRELLQFMHTHGNKDSLVYWLEFKNDEEFPGGFCSISRGRCHTFFFFSR